MRPKDSFISPDMNPQMGVLSPVGFESKAKKEIRKMYSGEWTKTYIFWRPTSELPEDWHNPDSLVMSIDLVFASDHHIYRGYPDKTSDGTTWWCTDSDEHYKGVKWWAALHELEVPE